MKTKIFTTLLVLLFASFIKSQDAKTISKKAMDIVSMDAMEMVSTLKIYDNKGNTRSRQVATAVKKFGNVSKTIVKFLAPADVKGTAMLIYDYENKSDEMWIYMPAIRKTRRIVSSEKAKSFMGSEFSNADMSKPNLDDYQYKVLGSEKINGTDCWKIEMSPLNDDIAEENGFSKKISWIKKSNYLSQKVDYYDLDGDLHKTLIIKNYKPANTKYIAFYMEMKNVQTGRKSVLTIDKFQAGSSMKEVNFSVAQFYK